mmetsp:Transcript_79498/g.165056  ORF Transcript_79498/g.165056 Transcript_79498/m.165056 type:complete len:225 (+) Transcript_79498:304-978(+)
MDSSSQARFVRKVLVRNAGSRASAAAPRHTEFSGSGSWMIRSGQCEGSSCRSSRERRSLRPGSFARAPHRTIWQKGSLTASSLSTAWMASMTRSVSPPWWEMPWSAGENRASGIATHSARNRTRFKSSSGWFSFAVLRAPLPFFPAIPAGVGVVVASATLPLPVSLLLLLPLICVLELAPLALLAGAAGAAAACSAAGVSGSSSLLMGVDRDGGKGAFAFCVST